MKDIVDKVANPLHDLDVSQILIENLNRGKNKDAKDLKILSNFKPASDEDVSESMDMTLSLEVAQPMVIIGEAEA